ncbi:MAG: AraC family transcriptional regulator [Acutalibacter sp.]|nr:AraC family transcriptional regulator [Acutalibacter sp.]
MICRNYMLKMYDSQNEIIAFPSRGYEAIIEHSHDFIELVYIVSGALTHCVRGQRIPLEKGDMFVIATSDPHSMVPSGDPMECSWVNCIASPRLFSQGALDLDPARVLNFSFHPDMIFLVNQMVREYQEQSPYSQEIMASLFSALLYKFRQENQASAGRPSSGKSQKDRYIQRATAFIQKNYQKKIYLEDIARSAGISTGYINKIFREERSTTPIEYLNICRVSMACHLLSNTNHSIAEICEQVGFHDMKFFYSMFKRQNGISPGAYRKMNQVDGG